MTETYESPRISAELGNLPSALSAERNPLARGYVSQVLDQIDGVAIEDLAAEHGSPLFVFSERTIREKADRMRTAFRSRYPDTQFFWSFKTNYLDAICSIFKSEGWGAEIVSGFEYAKARHLGYRGDEIIFNGPYKSPASIRRALSEGAVIQIDNWDDLERVEEAAADLGGTFDVGIRVWFATGHGPIWSKFGFSLASGEAQRAAVRIVESPRLRLHTLHSHIGTYMLDPEAYRVAVRSMLGLRAEIAEDTGHLVPCLNLGGGFPSYSLLHGMRGPAEAAVAPIERYAEAITSELMALPEKERPQLRLESGRHLVDEAGYLVGTVVAVKNAPIVPLPDATGLSALSIKESSLLTRAPKTSYVMDIGINLLYTAAWFEISVRPARETRQMPESARLVGDLCMEIDVIREDVALPRLRVGDRLTLWPVGAYNLGQSMQFIHIRPEAVLIDRNSQVHIIRRRERLEDVESAEVLPDYLSERGDV
ncbi:MAG: hypothetical protein JXJ18_05760 [Rhodobacteraceae bacterium]|nr:hypothetical protein [Paracoccaceae bacterium]